MPSPQLQPHSGCDTDKRTSLRAVAVSDRVSGRPKSCPSSVILSHLTAQSTAVVHLSLGSSALEDTVERRTQYRGSFVILSDLTGPTHGRISPPLSDSSVQHYPVVTYDQTTYHRFKVLCQFGTFFLQVLNDLLNSPPSTLFGFSLGKKQFFSAPLKGRKTNFELKLGFCPKRLDPPPPTLPESWDSEKRKKKKCLFCIISYFKHFFFMKRPIFW